MSIDTFMTSALADEFNDKLAGGRIQDTVEIDRETFGLEVYANRQRHYLLLSADNNQPRALIAPEKLRRGVQTASPLGLLFRHRVEGMLLQAVRQPPWERILIFDLMGPDGELQLIIELINRRANLLLVEGDMIIDCARRVGPQDNRYRIILPKHQYVPPPPMEDKLLPEKLTPGRIETLLRRHPDDKAWSVLVKGILGFSPNLAKEVVHRAYQRLNIKASEVNPYNIHAALESFVTRLLRRDWQPGLFLDEHEIPKGISVFPVTFQGEWRPTETVSEAIHTFYGEMTGGAVYEAARQPIRAQLQDARDRVARRLASLERELVDQEELEVLRKSGELLLAYQYTMQPGQEELVAQYDPEGEPLTIKVDTSITPLENAQRYFDRYERKKRAVEQLPQRIAKTRAELEYLDQLDADLDIAENWQDIGEVQDALQKDGYWRGKKYAQPKGGKSGPLRVVTEEGFIIRVGRNSRQNAQLLDQCDANDLWLHAREIAGSHVIIQTDRREVPEHVLAEAASYAAYYSKGRNEGKVLVQYAECRHIRKIRGGRPGQVTIGKEKGTIVVEPQPVED